MSLIIRLHHPSPRVASRPSEKIEDAKAKAAIRAQIEADKKARAERSAKEKALREGKIWTDAGAVEPTAAPAAAASTSAASGTKGAEYKDTRLQARRPSAYDNGVLYTDLTLSLQIRYTGGAPVSLTLPSESSTPFSILSLFLRSSYPCFHFQHCKMSPLSWCRRAYQSRSTP